MPDKPKLTLVSCGIPTPTVYAARKLADRFFAKRGNHSEVHLKRDDLMVLLGVAIEKGRELERTRIAAEAEAEPRGEDV